MKCPKEGTKFRAVPNSAAALFYPAGVAGKVGSATAIPTGQGRATCMPGPRGGLVYLRFASGRVQGVFRADLEPVAAGVSLSGTGLGMLPPYGRDLGEAAEWIRVGSGWEAYMPCLVLYAKMLPRSAGGDLRHEWHVENVEGTRLAAGTVVDDTADASCGRAMAAAEGWVKTHPWRTFC